LIIRIESLLSARLFMSPQRAGDRLYFISNLSGKMSLYGMDCGGSVPQPLLPPDIALQNPTLLESDSFSAFPRLGKILVMIDKDGDENYQPMLIPLEGGFPEPAFGDHFGNYRVHMSHPDAERDLVYLAAGSRQEQMNEAYQADLRRGTLTKLGASPWGGVVDGVNEEHTRLILVDAYTYGDHILYLWEQGATERRLLYGTPLEARPEGHSTPLSGIHDSHITDRDEGVLFVTALVDDRYGLGYLDLKEPDEVKPVPVKGASHEGVGELVGLRHLRDDRYLLTYNIDGCSWAYEGVFDLERLTVRLDRVIVGQGELAHGVLQAIHYDKPSDSYALSFSTATSPAQLYTVEGRKRDRRAAHTRERVLGIPQAWLSAGQDKSYASFDGQRISARLYLPAQSLGFQGPRPLVYYLHGGPQSQERPDFTWFSMPLIQFLTLHGFAVFVPNVRGSTGYGLEYTKRVDHDWGGDDRLDHVHAMQLLADDPRLDLRRAGVVGRSYGGYMTLTLLGRHPDLWSAGVDLFGPHDLFTFLERIPETWKPYFKISIGDPEKAEDRELLLDRSPKTHLHNLACPLLVIQGANDPRVVERESRDLVESLRAQGKQIEYLMFENEGHDVLKFENRVRCYNAITEFFERHLRP